MSYAVNDIIRVRIVSAYAAAVKTFFNVLHCKVTANGGAGLTPAQLAGQIDAQVGALLPALQSTAFRYRGLDIQKIAPSPPGLQVISTAAAAAGTLTGDILPLTVQGLTSWKASILPSYYNGRNYWAGATEAVNDAADLPSAGYVANLQALASSFAPGAFLTYTVGADSTEVRWGVWKPGIAALAIGLSYTASPQWATIRKRGNRGKHTLPPY